MDDAFLVGSLKSLAQLTEQAGGSFGAEAVIALQERVQRDAANELHDDARTLRIVERGIMEHDGIRVLEPCRHVGFAFEALAELGVGGDVLVHHLDHDLARQLRITGQVDLAHAAFAQNADGFVAAQKNSAEHTFFTRGDRVVVHGKYSSLERIRAFCHSADPVSR